MKRWQWGALGAAIFFFQTAVAPAADPAVLCQLGKLKTAAKYGSCRLNADAKGLKDNLTPDYSKCESTFGAKWQKSEDKAGIGICPTEGDEANIEARITHHADVIATLLGGGVPIDPYPPGTGQTTSYGAGDDGDVQAGAAFAYRDNGDGTITDLNTELMWEKKILKNGTTTDCSATEAGSCANPHDADNYYDWSDGACCAETDYDGGAVTIFLNQLNNRCSNDTTVSCTVDADCSVPGGPCGFAGYRDWRLPSVKELQGILDLGRNLPAVDPAFHRASCGALCTDITDPACSCTQSGGYWSATTYQALASSAWGVSFGDGNTGAGTKTSNYFVRAVRAGF